MPMIADEIYQDVAFDGPIAPIGSLDPDAPVISLSGLSKGYLVPGWRTGWLAVGGGDRLKDVLAAITKLAEGRLCSTMPMQRAIVRGAHRATGRISRRSARRCASARSSSTRAPTPSRASPRRAPSAAFYAMPKVESAARQDRRAISSSTWCTPPACCASTDRVSA